MNMSNMETFQIILLLYYLALYIDLYQKDCLLFLDSIPVLSSTCRGLKDFCDVLIIMSWLNTKEVLELAFITVIFRK